MVDRYTKIVLTLIAAALIWIAAKDVLPMTKAHAQYGEPVHVIVDAFDTGHLPSMGESKQLHVVLDSVDSGAFAYVSSPLPVKGQN